MHSETKTELRLKVKALKKRQTEEDIKRKSTLVFRQIEAMEEFKQASVVLAYWSIQGEVFTHEFVNKWWKIKTILLPVVDGDSLRIRKFSGMDSMKMGSSFGILEPTGSDVTDLDSIDLILIPGVAFDIQNHRMGRGKGYYDKLLTQTRARKVGIGFDFQIFPSVPTEPHDILMDQVIFNQPSD